MRNPLKRLALPEMPSVSFRERLDAAKGKLAAVTGKYGRPMRMRRAPVAVAEPVERIALINYATWLFFERRLVCNELQPEAGTKAAHFIHSDVEAERFFWPASGEPAAASSRAVATLDALGIDWRRDRRDSVWSDDKPRAEAEAALPHGWPAPDADLTEALDDLARLDAAIAAMWSGDPERDAETTPGYDDLTEAREAVIARLTKERARGMPGLQAKAHALLTPTVRGFGSEIEALSASLARDLVGARPSVLDYQHRPDPILSVLDEAERLLAAWKAAGKLPLPPGDLGPGEAEETAGNAFGAHVHDVLLKTVPTTSAGCAALAEYAARFCRREGWSFDDDGGREQAHAQVLDLIARSPMRA